MQIERIDDIHEFDKLKTTWESVHAADPHAHIFVSWAWLRSFFELSSYKWFALALRPNRESPPVAFFPLALENYKFNLVRVLRMGGAPFADYTGFVCLPEYEQRAIKAFADYVQHQLTWDRFHMKDVLDPRLDMFLETFSGEKFVQQQVEQMICPYIPLPDSWDEYLQETLGSRVRKQLRRSFRQVEALDDFRVTYLNKDNFVNQFDALLALWQARWGAAPVDFYSRLFLRLFKNNSLWLTVLWVGEEPLAALGAFLDKPKKTFYAFMGTYNDKFAKFSPGKVVDAYGIRYAIRNGFQTFDYLRGGHDYKFKLGGLERFSSYILLTPKDLRSKVANTAIDFVQLLQAMKT